jgi:hypothetical protein
VIEYRSRILASVGELSVKRAFAASAHSCLPRERGFIRVGPADRVVDRLRRDTLVPIARFLEQAAVGDGRRRLGLVRVAILIAASLAAPMKSSAKFQPGGVSILKFSFGRKRGRWPKGGNDRKSGRSGGIM